jgi:hypothetical protein
VFWAGRVGPEDAPSGELLRQRDRRRWRVELPAIRSDHCQADPFNEIEEADETNNCIANHIRLSGMGGPEPRVQVLGILGK